MKLHLGCGEKKIPGYINVDAKPTTAADLIINLEDIGDYYTNNSVDVIYMCHVLEHFERNAGRDLVKKLYHILVPGGVLRLAVPNFESVCNVYYKNKDINELHGLLYGRHDISLEGHYSIWDFEYMKKELINIGFNSVYKYSWRMTDHADMDDFSQAYLPHMDKENGILMSLNVEAIK